VILHMVQENMILTEPRASSSFRLFSRRFSARLTATILAIASVHGIAVAQTVEEDASPPATALNVPEDVVIFGENDPNLRKATAVVNNEIITGTDVDQRLALILAANEGTPSAEEVMRLRLQILRTLIDETLQIQEAAANEIVIANEEVEQTYEQAARQNFGQSVAALDAYLYRVGSSPSSLKRQILGEIAWNRLLGRNIRPFVNVAEEEVNDVLERLKAAKGTEEFRVGEIYMSANSQNEAEVFANMQKIIEQLQQGGSFVGYARQFSEASTAVVGGDLGWIRPAQLPPALATVVQSMGVGQLVGPVQIPGGFSIIYVIDKRQILVANPLDARLSLKQLSIAFPAGTTEAQATQRAAEFGNAVKMIKGCGQADEIAAQIGATVVNNDFVPVKEITAPQLQNTLLNMSIGEATPPFGSIEDGVRVLILCGRDDPQMAGGPDFDQMMGQMEDERLGKRAQIYLRDLRRDAVIEYN